MSIREKKLIERFERLLGQKCWSVYGCDSAETAINLSFGRKVKRESPLKNRTRPRIEKLYQGEFRLLIFCGWRIDSRTKPLITSREENGGRYKFGGPTLKTLKKLVGKKVIALNVSPPGFDFALEFEGGLTLKVFCDNVGNVDDYNQNYIFYSEHGPSFKVDVKGKLVVGK